MDTQNTPIHIRLWHRDFWLMNIAVLLLTMSVYMLIPILPPYLLHDGYSPLAAGAAVGIFGLGVFAFGPFCSYWVQRFKRHQVCLIAMTGVVMCIVLLYELGRLPDGYVELWMILLIRFLMGACFGLAQMVLSSTLIIDNSESFQRTEANYAAAWFARFSLALGPLVALFTAKYAVTSIVLLVAAGFAMSAMLVFNLIKFPFRAPSERMSVCSLDRFFLMQGFPLFLNLMLMTCVVGLLLGWTHSLHFYAAMLLGLILALLSEKYVFQNAELKSETLTGLLLLGVAVLLLITRRQYVVGHLVPALVGGAIGIISSRFLLFFLKLARHCQRGTSQSTFFLSWELGINLGLFLSIGVLNTWRMTVDEQEITGCQLMALWVSIILILVAFGLYNFIVHPWYLKHKNR